MTDKADLLTEITQRIIHSTEKSDLLSAEISQNVKNPAETNPVGRLVEQHVEDSKQDRELKKRYAYWFIGILIGQLIIMNIIFWCVGMSWLTFDAWTLRLFTGGTLLEVFGIVLVIAKNLFPSQKP